MQMQMTDEEIIYRWKNGARPPKEMVKIIAELNAVKESDIIKILFEHGERSGQAIYHYRKSGKLACDDEEAQAKANNAEKGGTDEGKEEKRPEKPKKPEKAEVSPAGVPLKADMPEGVKNILLGWLRDNRAEYDECVWVVKAYEQVLNYMKEAGEIVND